jgi:SAM-dependent methyltransferase
MINIGEGTKLTGSYTWFQDSDVIQNFLLSIDEIAGLLPNEIYFLGIGSGIGNLEYAVKDRLEQKYNKMVKLTLTDRIIDDTKKHNDVSIIQVDNKSLPFSDKTFDLVIARSVTHYEKDNEQELRVLSEINRVMTKEGYFITEAPYFSNKEEAKLLYDIHSLLPKQINLKTYNELLDIHNRNFAKVSIAKIQPDKLLFVEKKDFLKRYEVSEDTIQKILNLISNYKNEERPNVWVKDNDFGWSIKFAILICHN